MVQLVEWSEKFSLNISTIDNQHKRLVSLINEIHDLVLRKEFQNHFNRVIDDLKRYTEYHFKYEEALLAEHQYPGYEDHKHQHEEFIKIVNALSQTAQTRNGIFGSDILIVLKDWLMQHILIEDRAYADFLKSKGMT